MRGRSSTVLSSGMLSRLKSRGRRLLDRSGLHELRKAFEARSHAGIEAGLARLVRNAAPYAISPWLDAAPPLTIYWSINSVCNLRCRMCDVGTMNEEGTFWKTLRIDRKLHEIDIDVFKRTIDEVAADGPFIALNSTEPLMYAPLSEAIEHCTRRGLRTAVTTGGWSLPQRAEELADARLSRLVVSLDGPPAVHDAIRGRPGSFERSAEGIRRFAARSRAIGHAAEVYVSCTVTSLNHDQLVPLWEATKDLPIDQLGYCWMWFISDGIAAAQNAAHGERYPVSPSCFDAAVDPARVDVERLAAQVERLASEPRVRFMPRLDGAGLARYYHHPERPMVEGSRCMASWFFLQILADGKAVVYTRCHNHPVGNINEQPFYAIWNGQAMKEWREFIRRERTMPMCRRCDLAY